MPNVSSFIELGIQRNLLPARRAFVFQAQHQRGTLGMAGKNSKIDAVRHDSRAQWLRLALKNANSFFHIDGLGLIAYSRGVQLLLD